MLAGSDKVNFIIKTSAFHPNIKTMQRKFEIKTGFLFSFVSIKIINRIINDSDIKNCFV